MKQIVVIALFLSAACSQVVNQVRIIGHVEYILKVMQRTITEVEEREWCNLKLPDFSKTFNETVINHPYIGTVSYTNGFVVSIQQLDIPELTVQQIWSWNNTDSTGQVSLRGTLRMIDLTLGYNVEVAMQDGSHHRYTATFKHPTISFAFSINYNTHTQEITVTVVGTVIRLTNVYPVLSPLDTTSVVLTHLFDYLDTSAGIEAWGPDVFQPICTSVVQSVEFPRICYDCPV